MDDFLRADAAGDRRVTDQDVGAWLDGARPAETVHPVCLRGDLLAEFGRLDARLTQLEERGGVQDSLNSGTERRELSEQIEAVRRDMAAASVDFRLRALPRRRWTELVTMHEPREDNEVDRLRGFNVVTFLRALIVECTVEPRLSSDQWAHLLDDLLNDAQYTELADAAWLVNRRSVDVPFSRNASRILQTFGSE